MRTSDLLFVVACIYSARNVSQEWAPWFSIACFVAAVVFFVAEHVDIEVNVE